MESVRYDIDDLFHRGTRKSTNWAIVLQLHSDEITPKDGSSFSAPHELPQSQVLNDPDLLELIFSFFHVRTPPQSGPESLARRISFPDSQHLLWASLASKAFHDPAMDVLWRSLDSWLPLLRLISILDINGSSIVSRSSGYRTSSC